MRIAIVGGSLTGCMAAILLEQDGHDVTVYERSKTGLVGRGGGLTTSRKVLDELKALELIDAEFPASPFHELKMCKRSDVSPYLGINPLSRPIDMHCVHWGGLWSSLVKRVPSENYLRGRTVTSAERYGERVKLDFEDGEQTTADLVIFCDGYNSVGRQILFPETLPNYRGYLVWRGVLPDSKVADLAPLENHPRYSFATMKGSFVSFVVPSYEGSTKPGERTINWAAYLPVSEAELDHYLIGKDGRRRVGSVPSGEMRDELDQELKKLMIRELPDFYADILFRSSGNQVQLIYTCELDAYGRNRMCLMGDAGIVVQPMTGSGLFKGYSNARDLCEHLRQNTDIDAAIASWSAVQTRVARQMLDLGNQMEEAFIWDTIDLATSDPTACESWWDQSIQIPDEFSYFAQSQ